jgi:hypothetical protein
MKLNIHNQCSYFKLINPGCFSTRTSWNRVPDMEVDVGCLMSVDLMPSTAAFEGVLTYQLQRKHVNPNDQLGLVSLLFITWKSEGYKGLCVHVHLIEHNKQIKWNRHKLEEYYQRCVSQLNTYTGPIKDTWLIYDGTVLVTRLELDFTQRDGVLNIAISEGVMYGHIKRAEWIGSEM